MAGPTDLIAAVLAGDASGAEALLGTDPALVAARDAEGVSALLLARYRGDRRVMDALLAADPEMDVFEASAYGYIDRLVERLDEDPTRATARSTDGYTALHLAAFFGKAEAVRALLAAGARVDALTANEMANQPLHAAAAGRHIEICRLLVAAGAPVDVAEHGGYTPLHQAAQHGDNELVELLLSAGAGTDATDAVGRRPADLARAAGHEDLARRLDESRPTPPPTG